MVVGLEMAGGTLSRILKTATGASCGLLDISDLPGLGELKILKTWTHGGNKICHFPKQLQTF